MAIVVDGVTFLEGDGSWPWLKVSIDSPDLVVRGCECSWFNDRETASGISAATTGELGCALPMCVYGSACDGSPIPALPYRATTVRVYNPSTGRQVECILIDLGPAKSVRRGIDLTPAAFEALGIALADGVIMVDYRIFGGAADVEEGRS